jgi:hypothetical protein
MSVNEFLPLVIIGAIALIVGVPWFNSSRRLRRAEFIRTYRWPPGLLDRLARKHPALHRKETALVAHGLRHFFLAYLMSGNRFVSMPSQVADDLWHEFILYTREYKSFCDKAFGTFLHHTPAVALGENHRDDDGLWRVWWHCCREEASIRAIPPGCRFCSRSMPSSRFRTASSISRMVSPGGSARTNPAAQARAVAEVAAAAAPAAARPEVVTEVVTAEAAAAAEVAAGANRVSAP